MLSAPCGLWKRYQRLNEIEKLAEHLTSPVRVGIIGLGRMGRRHLEAYLRIPEVKVEACSDANPQALEFLKVRKVDCRAYPDWHEMLSKETLDLLSVVTNGPSHAEITIEGSNAKIPRVICEKPMATSINDAKRMIETTQTHGTLLSINYSRRWSPDYQKLKERIKSGAIGELCEIHAVCGGGQLACNGSHFFDLMRFLSDSEPVSVVGFVDKRGTPNPRGRQFNDPGGIALVRFANGLRGFVDMYEDLGIPPMIEVIGSIGRVTIDEVRNQWSLESRQGKDRSEPVGKYDLPLKQELLTTQPIDPLNLVGSTIHEVLHEPKVSCSGADGLASLQMVLGVHASDREGNAPIALPLASRFEDLTINFT
jgi:predicted dehydrogenase